jgi:hypothetical protein
MGEFKMMACVFSDAVSAYSVQRPFIGLHIKLFSRVFADADCEHCCRRDGNTL